MITRSRLVLMAGLVGVVALAVKPWTLAERSIERHLLASLAQQFVLAKATSSSGAVALLPFPRIVANDVELTTQDGSISARIPRLRADLSLLSLVHGRIEFDQLTVVSPQIDARLPDDGRDPMQLLSSHLLSELPNLPRVLISGDGSLFLRNDQAIISSVRDINVDISEHNKGEALQISGSFVWRGEKLDFAAATNSANRRVLPMLRIRSDLLSLDLISARSSAQNSAQFPVLDGQLQIAARSMSRLGNWLASGSPVLLPLGNTAVGGRLTLSQEGAQVSNAVVTLGTDTLDGALDWRRKDSRWRLTGTLAGKNLDIGRPQAGIDLFRINLPDPSATSQIDVEDLFAHDIDVRMSLQRVRLPGLVLTDVAGQIMATDKRLDLSITNAGLYGGVLRGRGSIARAPLGIEVRTQITADRTDLTLLSQEFFETRRITGLASFQQNIETTGRTPLELIMNANGRLGLTVRNGDFMGTNLNEAMRRIERQPLSVARDWRGGRTSFEELALNAVVAGGVLDVNEARGAGASFRIGMEGQISLLERLFKLNGQVRSINGGTSIPFEVTGPILEPLVQVNARAFLERSGAAAPLLPQRAN